MIGLDPINMCLIKSILYYFLSSHHQQQQHHPTTSSSTTTQQQQQHLLFVGKFGIIIQYRVYLFYTSWLTREIKTKQDRVK